METINKNAIRRKERKEKGRKEERERKKKDELTLAFDLNNL